MTIKEEIQALKKKTRYTIEDLRTITRILRSEEGCPWDREQNHHSIRRHEHGSHSNRVKHESNTSPCHIYVPGEYQHT
jgi:hypothetical protein